MSRYLIEENIRRFHRLLEQALEPERRRTVETLLAEEEAKLDGLGTDGPEGPGRIEPGA